MTPAEFDQANADGIPHGVNDAVNGVEVPAESSLLVTYHFEWAGLKEPVAANCAGTCEKWGQIYFSNPAPLIY